MTESIRMGDTFECAFAHLAEQLLALKMNEERTTGAHVSCQSISGVVERIAI